MNTPGLMNDAFSKIEVVKAINYPKTRKAQGIDMIPNEVLKNLTMKEFLHKFINLSLINKCMPSVWNLGIIKPIPKGADKDPNIPINYRGITLLP